MRIAIIRLSAFGDIVIASSMLYALKALNNPSIEWFVDERFAGILGDSPCITKIHSLPFKKLLRSIGGILEVREYCKSCGKYDIVIDMQGLIKSALVGKFLIKKHFIGFSRKSAREGLASFFYNYRVNIPYDSNILERNFKVVFDYFLQQKESNLHLQKAIELRSQSLGVNHRNLNEQLIQQFKISQQYNFLFVIEASIQEKMYPIDRFASLATLLYRFLPESLFYIAWHDNEENANNLMKLLNQQAIPAYKLPKLDFNALKFCLTQMSCVIGGDTGVTHLAWALNIPCITLYGNTNTTSGKNMSNTKLGRVLLGNPYVVSQSNVFEIQSISPSTIFEVFKHKIYKDLHEE